MSDEILPKKLYVGACIYCGSTENLSDEHILPEGLGGRDVLIDASCEPCRQITARFEDHVLRKMVRPMRMRLGFRGKRPHPKTIPAMVLRQDGTTAIEEIPTDDVVMAALLPSYAPPGILTGAPPEELRGGKLHILGNKETAARLAKQGIVGETSHPLAMIEFTRMIAKIAHAGAVQRLGLSGFQPFLSREIITPSNRIYYYVGCESHEIRARDHRFGSWITGELVNHDEGTLVVMYVRLFSQLPSPIYQVVAGRYAQ